MKETNLITVSSVSEEREDKNGRIYKAVEFSNPEEVTIVDEATGEILKVREAVKRCNINRYKESYMDDKQEFMYDAKVGEKTPGAIVTQLVAPYEIGERTVDSYTAVIFGRTSSKLFPMWVTQTFKRAGHPLNDILAAEEIERRKAIEHEERAQLEAKFKADYKAKMAKQLEKIEAAPKPELKQELKPALVVPEPIVQKVEHKIEPVVTPQQAVESNSAVTLPVAPVPAEAEKEEANAFETISVAPTVTPEPESGTLQF